MPIISAIPKRYVEGFKKIALSEPKAFAALEEGISLSSLVSSIPKLIENIVKLNNNLNLDEIRDIFLSVGSLVPFLDNETSVDKLVTELSTIAVETSLIDKEQKKEFAKKIASLLNYPQIYYAAKASDVSTEYANVFIQAKIVTDLRPVFSIDVKEFPKAGMILHNLHIHYVSDIEGDHKDIFIALDSKDIKVLKELLMRAEDKEKTFKEIFAKTGIENLNE